MSAVCMCLLAPLLLYILCRLLHLSQPPACPTLHYRDRGSAFVQSVLEMCPSLSQPYVPTFLWGKSGHMQTLAFAVSGKLGGLRVEEVPVGVRRSKIMEDGSTIFYDIYEPQVQHKTKGEYCLLLCPGIGNTSESAYIQALVHHSLASGYLSVVLNHLGALESQPLSAPRLFTYGGTQDLHCVRLELQRLYPAHHVILVGLSMGANVVVKYLGESAEHQRGVLGAVSVCQGYSIDRCKDQLASWKGLRRGYQMVITRKQKMIILRHKDVLLSGAEMERLGMAVQQQGGQHREAQEEWLRQIMAAEILGELDEAYFRRVNGFDNLDDFYIYHNSCNYILNVKTPLLVVNAQDDPIVPEELLQVPRDAAARLPNCIFALTQHGGHLGYFEAGWVKPRRTTWMDRVIVEYCDAISTLHHAGSLPTGENAGLPQD